MRNYSLISLIKVLHFSFFSSNFYILGNYLQIGQQIWAKMTFVMPFHPCHYNFSSLSCHNLLFCCNSSHYHCCPLPHSTTTSSLNGTYFNFSIKNIRETTNPSNRLYDLEKYGWEHNFQCKIYS